MGGSYKRLIKCIVVLACFGCVNSDTPRIYYNNLKRLESVEVKQLGVGFMAPIDRFSGGTSDRPILGRMSTCFRLHEMAPGPFAEFTTYKITIVIQVFNNSEWQRILRGDSILDNADLYGNYARKFCPYYLNHRKDVMAPDGSVAVAYAILNTWRFDNRANGEVEDEITVKRIIESVHFLTGKLDLNSVRGGENYHTLVAAPGGLRGVRWRSLLRAGLC